VSVLAVAGFRQSAIDSDLSLSAFHYLIRGVGDLNKPKTLKWTIEATGTSIRCAYATMASLGSPEASSIRFAALNCGTDEAITRDYDTREEQRMYVMEVRATDSYDGGYDLIASARGSITGSSTDTNNPGLFLDGPIATNDFGQAFLFGTRFVYLVSGFSYGDL